MTSWELIPLPRSWWQSSDGYRFESKCSATRHFRSANLFTCSELHCTLLNLGLGGRTALPVGLGAPRLGRHRIHHPDELAQVHRVLGNLGRNRRSGLEGLVLAAEVVVPEVQRYLRPRFCMLFERP